MFFGLGSAFAGRLGSTGSRPARATGSASPRPGRTAGSAKAARAPHTASSNHKSKHPTGTYPAGTSIGAGSAEKTTEEKTWVDQITRLEHERIQADLTKDKTWYDNYFADDFTVVTPDGKVADKAQFIADCLDPADTLESETYDEFNTRVYGDVVIATGKASCKGKANGEGYDTQRRFTSVWVNRAGRWQQVAMQQTTIVPGQEPSPTPQPGNP